MKFELAVLNTALKDLNKNWDFTVLINPLLADQGLAIAVVPKLKRQIDRMTKLRIPPKNGRFGEAVTNLPHATRQSKAARETGKRM